VEYHPTNPTEVTSASGDGPTPGGRPGTPRSWGDAASQPKLFDSIQGKKDSMTEEIWRGFCWPTWGSKEQA